MDPTLNNYIHAKPFVSSRGTWCALQPQVSATFCSIDPPSVETGFKTGINLPAQVQHRAVGSADVQLRQLPKIGRMHGLRSKHAALHVSDLSRALHPLVNVRHAVGVTVIGC